MAACQLQVCQLILAQSTNGVVCQMHVQLLLLQRDVNSWALCCVLCQNMPRPIDQVM